MVFSTCLAEFFDTHRPILLRLCFVAEICFAVSRILGRELPQEQLRLHTRACCYCASDVHCRQTVLRGGRLMKFGDACTARYRSCCANREGRIHSPGP